MDPSFVPAERESTPESRKRKERIKLAFLITIKTLLFLAPIFFFLGLQYYVSENPAIVFSSAAEQPDIEKFLIFSIILSLVGVFLPPNFDCGCFFNLIIGIGVVVLYFLLFDKILFPSLVSRYKPEIIETGYLLKELLYEFV